MDLRAWDGELVELASSSEQIDWRGLGPLELEFDLAGILDLGMVVSTSESFESLPLARNGVSIGKRNK